MIGKEYRQIITLFIFLIVLDVFTRVSAAEKQKGLVRRKRNIICLLGLTGFISDIFYEALKGVGKLDPVVVNSLLNGKVQDVTLQGLSSLRNDTNIDVYCHDEMVILHAPMSLSDVTFSCKWSQKVLMTLSGTVTATVDDIRFQVEGSFTMNDGIVLDVNVELTKLDGLNFGFSGLGPLNPAIKLIVNTVLDIFEREISKKIEKDLKSILKSELGKYKMPF